MITLLKIKKDEEINLKLGFNIGAGNGYLIFAFSDFSFEYNLSDRTAEVTLEATYVAFCLTPTAYKENGNRFLIKNKLIDQFNGTLSRVF